MTAKNKVKTALLLTSTLTVMAGATIAPSLPKMAEVFSGVPNGEFLTKLVVSLPALFIALFGPLAGLLIDRLGRLPLLMASMVLYALAGGSGLFLDDLYQILVGRALLGLSVAGIMTIVITLVGDYFEGEERQKFLGYQSGAMAFGGVVYVGLGGLLADVSWRAPFGLYIAAILFIPMIFFWLKEPVRPDKAPKGSITERSHIDPSVWLIYTVAFLGMIMFYIVPVQLPFFLKSIGVLQNSLAGLAIMAMTLIASIVALNYPKIKKRLTYQAIFALVFLFIGMGYTLVYLSNTYIMVVTAMFVTGMGAGMMMPNTNSWLMEKASPANRGKIMGGLTMAIFLGQFMSPVIVQGLAGKVSLQESFGLSGGVMAVFALTFGFYAMGRRTLH